MFIGVVYIRSFVRAARNYHQLSFHSAIELWPWYGHDVLTHQKVSVVKISSSDYFSYHIQQRGKKELVGNDALLKYLDFLCPCGETRDTTGLEGPGSGRRNGLFFSGVIRRAVELVFRGAGMLDGCDVV